ncbi:ubiquitin carboxyl-terminal hydrolase 15-like isoform X2 [Zophobas morio]|uniref:ubiquitin carboxyl-terminal hydrolase 15-like isoform X2 n=1 Tax=Zophobas morio TaxID=2755281 RepID=UPI003082D784
MVTSHNLFEGKPSDGQPYEVGSKQISNQLTDSMSNSEEDMDLFELPDINDLDNSQIVKVSELQKPLEEPLDAILTELDQDSSSLLSNYSSSSNSSSPLHISDFKNDLSPRKYEMSRPRDLGLKRNTLYESESSISPGLCGLKNLGNTCFMSSGLQCLSNIPFLTYYFTSNRFLQNINKVNPLGMKGKIAEQYGALIRNMWKGLYSCIAPYEFKETISEFAPQFAGFNQHDSQEFIAFLLDALHEDLNLVIKKPYVETVNSSEYSDDHTAAAEAWRRHLQRNRSVVVDLFQAQLKSTVICKECDKVFVTFDPYMYVSLPVPYNASTFLRFVFVPMCTSRPPLAFGVQVERHATVAELKTVASDLTGVRSEWLCFAEIYNHLFFSKLRKHFSLSIYANSEAIFVYETAHVEKTVSPSGDGLICEVCKHDFYPAAGFTHENCLLFVCRKCLRSYVREFCEVDCKAPPSSVGCPLCRQPILFQSILPVIEGGGLPPAIQGGPQFPAIAKVFVEQRVADAKRLTSTPVDLPLLISWDSGHPITFLQLRGLILSVVEDRLIKSDKLAEFRVAAGSFSLRFRNRDSCPRCCRFLAECQGCPLPTEESLYSAPAIACVSFEWPSEEKREFYSITLKSAILPHESHSSEPPKCLTIFDTLERFTIKEVLSEADKFYCTNCKDLKQISKQVQFWSTPKVLVFLLKRFRFNERFRTKIEIPVSYPLYNLNIEKFMAPRSTSTDNDGEAVNWDPSLSEFDLFGVSNHHGSLYSGHYTSYAKNFCTGKWYYFNDSNVCEVSEETVLNNADAYVLFYCKKSHVRELEAARLNLRTQQDDLFIYGSKEADEVC